MEFRPCIDIHNGKVKQIVGGSLRDHGDTALENYVSPHDADYFAEYYKKRNLKGGHVILLNAPDSPYYQESRAQAFSALRAFPGGLQIGGGVNTENALEYLNAGAAHIIVTSYVFRGGRIHYDSLRKLNDTVGQNKLVLDLSCARKGNDYYIVTDRWQRFTEVALNPGTLDELASYCCEFLIHAVDAEGKSEGIETELVKLLGDWNKIPITYAGGVHTYQDLAELKTLGKNKINVTIGSALSLFGGPLNIDQVLQTIQ